ncbi:MAG: hypothetical protein WCF92_00550 [bacterium]
MIALANITFEGWFMIVGLTLLFGFFPFYVKHCTKKEEIEKNLRESEEKELTEILSGKKFLVVLRFFDGKRTSHESELLEALIKKEALIQYVTPLKAKELWSGYVEPSEMQEKISEETETDFILVGTVLKENNMHTIDFRLFKNDGTTILGAGYTHCYSSNVIKLICTFIKRVS